MKILLLKYPKNRDSNIRLSYSQIKLYLNLLMKTLIKYKIYLRKRKNYQMIKT